jgi:hypothetical protein
MGALVRNLVRRVTALSLFHCGTKWPADDEIPELIAAGEAVRLVRTDVRWVDWERYSTRQRTTMKFGGIVGGAVYEGNIGPLMPLIVVGAFVHVGRHCVFGNGRFGVEGLA